MKKFAMLLGFISAAVFSTASAEINISGQIQDAHWTKDLSPYKVQGRAVIPEGSTVTVEPGVQVLFVGQSVLEVRGALHVDGNSADPAQFNLLQGGLNSYLLVKGGELKATNAVFLGGVLALENAKVDVQGCEVAKGSGPYLLGATQAVFRNDKIYGNASGATLDGDGVQAVFEFDTLVQNTYGLHLKKYASLKFENNSLHDNRQFQAVNDSSKAPALGDNYWGSLDVSQVAVKGKVDLGSPKALKDIIRAYVKTQLPRIPAGKVAQVARQAKAERAAVKSDARKADALRKKMADAVLQAEKNKKLAEAKKAREEKAKALAEKRAEARKAAAEALAQKKADAAAKRKAAAEALAQRKSDAAAKLKAAAEAAEPAKAPAEAAPAASTELELSPAAAEPTTVPTIPASTLEVPAAPLMETPSPAAVETTAPAAPASTLEVPTAPSMEAPAPAAAETPAPAGTPAPAATTSTLEVPGIPSMEAPALNDSTTAPAEAAPAAPAADSTAKPPAATVVATPALGQAAPSMEIPAPPGSDGASALDNFNPSDIPAPPGAPAASSVPAATSPSADVPAPPANPEPAKAVETPSAPAAPASTPATTAPAAVPPAIPSDLAPPAGTDDLGKLDLPPMNDKAVSAPKDMDLPPVDDLGKLDLDLK